jgi:hypothetical protein
LIEAEDEHWAQGKLFQNGVREMAFQQEGD